MFGNRTATTHDRAVTHDAVARGGLSFGAILTGVVVAFGAMFLLSAIVGGILTALGVADTNVTTSDAVDAGIGAGIAFVVAQFLSYLWGGYTAGRMARGSGVGNGLLVPLLAIILAVAVGAIVTALGAQANLNLPFSTNQLPLENDNLVDWGIGIGIASLIAMFLGGALGGALGHRWHTKLERRSYDENLAHTHDTDTHGTRRGETIDLREQDQTRQHAGVGSTAAGTTSGYAGGAAATHGTDRDGDGHADSGYTAGTTDRDGDGYADRQQGSAYTVGEDDTRRTTR